MENIQENNFTNKPSSSRYIGGLIVIIIGVAFLLDNLNLGLPGWLFDWPIFLIGLGIFLGARKNFNGIGWLVLILVGGYNLALQITDFDLSKYALGIGLVILGGYLILRPKNSNRLYGRRNRRNSFQNMPGGTDGTGPSTVDQEYFDASAVFGSVNQSIISKTLKGGKVSATFGGAEINLSQADFSGTVVVELYSSFGGIKMIVPPNWIIRNNISPIFGNVDDKRMMVADGGNSEKILVLEGSVTFGGVEIRSF